MGDALPNKAGQRFAQTFTFLRRSLLFACFLCVLSDCYRWVFGVSSTVRHMSCADFCFRWHEMNWPGRGRVIRCGPATLDGIHSASRLQNLSTKIRQALNFPSFIRLTTCLTWIPCL